MRRFPLIRDESRSWRLPLSGSTASQLTHLLLDEKCDRQDPRISGLVASDPALAIWLVCRADDEGRPAVTTHRELAQWFADALPHLLDWSVPEADDGSSLDADRCASQGNRVCWTDLVSRSLKIALLSQQLAESGDSKADPASAYFLGLLHAAPDWLESSMSDAVGGIQASTPASPQASTCLPDWLTDKLAQIRAGSAIDPVVDCVCCALSLLAESADPSSEKQPPAYATMIDDAHQQAAAALKRWTRRHADASKILSRLCQRLSRLDRLEQQFADTLRTAKLDAMKELAYGAGHEINNPLANISTRAQTMLRDETDPQRRQMLATINRQAFRAHEMISDMMLFARPPEPQPEACDLSAIIRGVVDELQGEAEQQGTKLSVNTTEQPLTLDADPRQLEVVMRAMCRNSLEAIGGGGEVDLRWRSLDSITDRASEQPEGPGRWIEIVIEDDGPGMDDREWEHLFDPFFSGREAGRGLGFGLSKCWRIVTGHGGRIDVEQRTMRGTRFRLLLPRDWNRGRDMKAAG